MSPRRSAIAIVSIALHVAFFLSLALVPKPERVEPEEIGSTPIEIVPWREDVKKPGAPEPVATDAGEAPAAGAPIADPSGEPPAVRPTTQRPRTRAVEPPGEPSVDPASAITPPTADSTTKSGTQPPAKALALHGLRDLADSNATVTSPRFSPSAIGPAPSVAKGGDDIGPQAADPVDRGTPRTLADAGFVPDRKGNHIYKSPQNNFVATMLPDGRVRFKDKLVQVSPTAIRGPDLYTIIRKAQKRELWANDKAKLLERTFDLRLAVALAFAEDNIDRRLKVLYRDLIDAWGADRPVVARRKTIFDRWDECDESMRVKLPGFEDATHSRIDELRKTAGQRARDEIHGFIRKHIPKSSADAYPEAELAELNRKRKSKQRFAPYDDP
jgi:hypothetical protein